MSVFLLVVVFLFQVLNKALDAVVLRLYLVYDLLNYYVNYDDNYQPFHFIFSF